jgi:2-(1,2-epoxy-1,2-dihydrophenyl)acetyl-CoA isomerase
MSDYKYINFTIVDSVGILALNSPETLNALTFDMADEICHALDHEVEQNSDIRCLVFTGEGRGFCSGQNLKNRAIESDGLVDAVMATYFPIFDKIRKCRVPVICAINGVAAGGGCSLALAGDIIFAARSAKFIQVFSRIGLVPDIGSTYLLPRSVGRTRALKMMMTNDQVSAENALKWGMVTDVYDDDALRDEAISFAKRLAAGPTKTLIATRELVDRGQSNDFATQFRSELQVQSDIRNSTDGKEGVAAFIEKRPARFTGQ